MGVLPLRDCDSARAPGFFFIPSKSVFDWSTFLKRGLLSLFLQDHQKIPPQGAFLLYRFDEIIGKSSSGFLAKGLLFLIELRILNIKAVMGATTSSSIDEATAGLAAFCYFQ